MASFAFGEDAEVLEDRVGIRKLIDQMNARTEDIRRMESGELVPEECVGQRLVKRPFDNAENDFHPSNRVPEKNLETIPSQQLAEDATSDPMDVDDFGGHASERTFPTAQDMLVRDMLARWKDDAVEGYDGVNYGGVE